jgi:hypothetical protein
MKRHAIQGQPGGLEPRRLDDLPDQEPAVSAAAASICHGSGRNRHRRLGTVPPV